MILPYLEDSLPAIVWSEASMVYGKDYAAAINDHVYFIRQRKPSHSVYQEGEVAIECDGEQLLIHSATHLSVEGAKAMVENYYSQTAHMAQKEN
jgi:hypothetical protein